jgi:aspartate aminotransferase-like enzyme
MREELLMAPGPTQVPERARLAMAQTLFHHRTARFSEVVRACRDGLTQVFGAPEAPLLLTCSGTGAFEAAMINFTRRGERVACVGGGKFGERWGAVGRAYGLDVVDVELEWGEALEPERLDDLLREDPACRVVTISASETSTGVFHPMERIAEVARSHGALLMVDGITAVGVHALPMAEWGIDVMVCGSQKSFALPPGMGFVAASQRAWERAERSDHPRYYFDLARERKKQAGLQTAFTPAITIAVGLEVVLEMMLEEGVDGVVARHARHGEATRAAARALGLELLAASPSNATTAMLVPEGVSAPAVCAALHRDYGVRIAGGQEHLKPRLLRFGHLGFVTERDVLAGLAALERALGAAGHAVEVGAGVAAASRSYDASR